MHFISVATVKLYFILPTVPLMEGVNSLVSLHDCVVRGVVGVHEGEVTVQGRHHLLGRAVGQVTCQYDVTAPSHPSPRYRQHDHIRTCCLYCG